jgi:hypothetical protein
MKKIGHHDLRHLPGRALPAMHFTPHIDRDKGSKVSK